MGAPGDPGFGRQAWVCQCPLGLRSGAGTVIRGCRETRSLRPQWPFLLFHAFRLSGVASAASPALRCCRFSSPQGNRGRCPVMIRATLSLGTVSVSEATLLKLPAAVSLAGGRPASPSVYGKIVPVLVRRGAGRLRPAGEGDRSWRPRAGISGKTHAVMTKSVHKSLRKRRQLQVPAGPRGPVPCLHPPCTLGDWPYRQALQSPPSGPGAAGRYHQGADFPGAPLLALSAWVWVTAPSPLPLGVLGGDMLPAPGRALPTLL